MSQMFWIELSAESDVLGPYLYFVWNKDPFSKSFSVLVLSLRERGVRECVSERHP